MTTFWPASAAMGVAARSAVRPRCWGEGDGMPSSDGRSLWRCTAAGLRR